MAIEAKKLYIVEHMDPELGPWSELEYQCIAQETAKSDARFLLSNIAQDAELPTSFKTCQGLEVEHRSVKQIFDKDQDKASVCLLYPNGPQDLSPDDANTFDTFLFGGILGMYGLLWSAEIQLNIMQEMIRLEVSL